MHLWSSVTFSLVVLSPLVSATQTWWHSEPTISSTTLVDALSADPDFTSLLRLLQRARLIPTLNRLNGSTLFAPTNDAIKRRISSNVLWHTALEGDQFAFNDNVQEKLRQELLYHLLNYSLPATPAGNNIQIHKTLHFPRTAVEPPSREPPPFPPWMPIPGGTLGGEPQRLRVASRDGSVWVGVDAFGKGGAEVVKGQVDAGNGVLLGISEVLDVPLDLGECAVPRFHLLWTNSPSASVVSQHSSVSYFQRILTPEITNLLNNTPQLTLFLPVDAAWDELDPLERLYLESEFATDDLHRIVNMHAVVEKGVKWSDTFNPAVNCELHHPLSSTAFDCEIVTTIDGTNLEIVVAPEKTMVSTADLIKPDIYASNGVLHFVSSLLVPEGALQLTAEKYLLALNCTSFVSLLHSVNLTYLINDTDTKYTILAPRDDVLSVFGDSDLPERGSEELKKLLSYHFLPGRWTPKKLKDGMLVETELMEAGLDGGRQVLDVEVNEDGKKKKDSQIAVRFGGAGIVGDPGK
jgi:solute carrier family 25 carnitine/acylcarnitine transporter 20/29